MLRVSRLKLERLEETLQSEERTVFFCYWKHLGTSMGANGLRNKMRFAISLEEWGGRQEDHLFKIDIF